MGLRDFTITDLIERNARVHANRLAFACGDDRISHLQYAQRVERLAGGLARLGVVPGERIAVLAQNCQEYVDLYGAAARLGAIVVPMNWRLSADEIAYMIENCSPCVLVAGAEYLGLFEAGQRIDSLPCVKHWYTLGAPAGRFEAFAQLPCAAPGGPPVAAAQVGSDSAFVIMYTAGVDGRPRGAVLTHGGLLAANLQFVISWQLSVQDVQLGCLPMFHAFGLGLLLAVQQAGGATVLLPRFEVDVVCRLIERERVTVFAEFPPMLSTLLDSTQGQPHALASIRHVTGLDSAQVINLFEERFPAATFWAIYGQTEVSGPASFSPFRERPGAAGLPCALCKVAVVDELGEAVPAGQSGEIVVRGPTVFAGYWECGEANRWTFRGDWHHTGDLGHLDDDGYLWWRGRLPSKDLIKPGGENVYPAEVESALLQHPAVAEAVAFGVEDAQWGEAIKAVCVCRPGHQVAASDLIEFVGSRIARFKRPKYLVFGLAIPRMEDGSPDRTRAKAQFQGA